MAVYTAVAEADLRALLAGYEVGELVDFEGIATGIENSNFFVTTSRGEYVLTLFESIPEEDLPYFLRVMGWLADAGIPSARPVVNRDGSAMVHLSGKPAALVERLAGASHLDPGPTQCAAAGQLLGRLHRAGRGFPEVRSNPRGAAWRTEMAGRLLSVLQGSEADLLRKEIRFQEQSPDTPLPQGLVHADLFRDNVLFQGNRISGVVDFYYACTDSLLLDLAIAANDWCTDAGGAWIVPKIEAFFDGYRQERTLHRRETAAWPKVVRAAALRFWLSRLQDKHFPRIAGEHLRKDPGEYQQLLRCRIADGEVLAGYLA